MIPPFKASEKAAGTAISQDRTSAKSRSRRPSATGTCSIQSLRGSIFPASKSATVSRGTPTFSAGVAGVGPASRRMARTRPPIRRARSALSEG